MSRSSSPGSDVGSRHATHWPAVAAQLGFRGTCGAARTRAGYALEPDGDWLALRELAPHRGDPLRDFAGAPGLWRGVDAGRGVELRFDLPPIGPDPGAATGDRRHPYRALLDWAQQTRHRDLAPLDPPDDEDLARWLAPARRNIRAGAHVAQIEVVAKPERLALVVSPLVRIPADLPAARRSWVAALCHDAQRRWRLVRFSIDAGDDRVCAEVDLSGAPTDRIQSLFELAGTALASSAAWALPGLALVTDPSVESRLLDQPPDADASGRTDPTPG